MRNKIFKIYLIFFLNLFNFLIIKSKDEDNNDDKNKIIVNLFNYEDQEINDKYDELYDDINNHTILNSKIYSITKNDYSYYVNRNKEILPCLVDCKFENFNESNFLLNGNTGFYFEIPNDEKFLVYVLKNFENKLNKFFDFESYINTEKIINLIIKKNILKKVENNLQALILTTNVNILEFIKDTYIE